MSFYFITENATTEVGKSAVLKTGPRLKSKKCKVLGTQRPRTGHGNLSNTAGYQVLTDQSRVIATGAPLYRSAVLAQRSPAKGTGVGFTNVNRSGQWICIYFTFKHFDADLRDVGDKVQLMGETLHALGVAQL